MKKWNLLILLAIFALPKIGVAEIVIDNFTLNTVDGPVYSGNGITVQRTTVNAVGTFGTDGILFSSDVLSKLIYTVSGGTFGDIDADFSNGFSIGMNILDGSSFNLDYESNLGVIGSVPVSDQVLQVNHDLAGANQLTFNLTRLNGTFATLGGTPTCENGAFCSIETGNLNVVPEPTTLVLEALMVGALAMGRRRRPIG